MPITRSEFKNFSATINIVPYIDTNFEIHKCATDGDCNVYTYRSRNHNSAKWVINFKKDGTCSFSHKSVPTGHLNSNGGGKNSGEKLMMYNHGSTTPGGNEIFRLVWISEDVCRIQANWNQSMYIYLNDGHCEDYWSLNVADDNWSAKERGLGPNTSYFYLRDSNSGRYLTKNDFLITYATYDSDSELIKDFKAENKGKFMRDCFSKFGKSTESEPDLPEMVLTKKVFDQKFEQLPSKVSNLFNKILSDNFKEISSTVCIVPFLNEKFAVHRQTTEDNNFERVWLGESFSGTGLWKFTHTDEGICYFVNPTNTIVHLDSLGGCHSNRQDLGVYRHDMNTIQQNQKFKLVLFSGNDVFRIQTIYDPSFYFYICNNSPTNKVFLDVTSDAIASSYGIKPEASLFKLYDSNLKRFLTADDFGMNPVKLVSIMSSDDEKFSISRINSATETNARVHLWKSTKPDFSNWLMTYTQYGICGFSLPWSNIDHLNASGGAKSINEALCTYRHSTEFDTNEIFKLIPVDYYTFKIAGIWDKRFCFRHQKTPANGVLLDVSSDSDQNKFKLYDNREGKFLSVFDLGLSNYTNTVCIIPDADTSFAIHRQSKSSDREPIQIAGNTKSDVSKWTMTIDLDGKCYFTTPGTTQHVNAWSGPESKNEDLYVYYSGGAAPYENELFKIEPVNNNTFRIKADWTSDFYIYLKSDTVSKGTQLEIARHGSRPIEMSKFKFLDVEKSRYITAEEIGVGVIYDNFTSVKEKFYSLADTTGDKLGIISLKDQTETQIQKPFDINLSFKQSGSDYVFDYLGLDISPTGEILKTLRELWRSENFVVDDGYLNNCGAMYSIPRDISADFTDMIASFSKLFKSYTVLGNVSSETLKDFFFKDDKLRSWCVNSFFLHKLLREKFPEIDSFVPRLDKNTFVNFNQVCSDAIKADVSLSDAMASKQVAYYNTQEITSWNYPLTNVTIKKENGEYMLYIGDVSSSNLIYYPSTKLFKCDKVEKTYKTSFGNKSIKNSIDQTPTTATRIQVGSTPEFKETLLWTVNYVGCYCRCPDGKDAQACAFGKCTPASCLENGKIGTGHNDRKRYVYGLYLKYTDIDGNTVYDFGFDQNKTHFNGILSGVMPQDEQDCSTNPKDFWTNAELSIDSLTKDKSIYKNQVDKLINSGSSFAKSVDAGPCRSIACSWGSKANTTVPVVDYTSAVDRFDWYKTIKICNTGAKSIWFGAKNIVLKDVSTCKVSPSNNPCTPSSGRYIHAENAKSSAYAANFFQTGFDIMRIDDRIAYVYKKCLETNIVSISNQLTYELDELCKLCPEILIPARLQGYLSYACNRLGSNNNLFINLESPVCPGAIISEKAVLMPHQTYLSTPDISFTSVQTTHGKQVIDFKDSSTIGFDKIYTSLGTMLSTVSSNGIPAIVIPTSSNPIEYLEKNLITVQTVPANNLQQIIGNGISLVFNIRGINDGELVYSLNSDINEAVAQSCKRGSFNLKNIACVRVSKVGSDVEFSYSTSGETINVLKFQPPNSLTSTGVSKYSFSDTDSGFLIQKNLVKDTLVLPSAFRTCYRTYTAIKGE